MRLHEGKPYRWLARYYDKVEFNDAPHITHGCRTHYLARKAPVIAGRKNLIPQKRNSTP
jgi:hypothetical protein